MINVCAEEERCMLEKTIDMKIFINAIGVKNYTTERQNENDTTVLC